MDVFSSYVPLQWQKEFHESNAKFISLAGGKGSGKTFAAIQELLTCALECAGTTYLIGRKTLPSLKDTTWKDFLEVVPQELVQDYNKTERNLRLINNSTFIGRPLDEPKKFDSLKISGFFIDEADEIDEDIWKTLKDRVREIKKNTIGQNVIPRYRGIISLNPTDEDHWIPTFFLDPLCPKDHKLFLSSALDNVENLPPGYIEQLRSNYTEDMQQRIIYGQFGKVHKGRPVFPSFQRGNYIFPIEAEEGTIFRGWDFGYNRPSVVFGQFINGQIRILAEKKGKKIYLDDFINNEVFPMQEELFKGNFVYKDFCDPRGSDESDKGSTSIQILNDHGIFPIYRRTRIMEGIKAIKELLDGKTDAGDKRFVIHPRCKMLIEGFRGGYHRMDNEEEPEKDKMYEDLFDALRYMCVHLVARFRFNKAQGIINSNTNAYINKHSGRRVEY